MTSPPSEPSENEPLLPPSAHMAPASRSKLHARRYLPEPQSDKARGKQRAVDDESDDDDASPSATGGKGKERAAPVDQGRPVTVIFSNESEAGGNLEVWVEDGESVGKVKDKVGTLVNVAHGGLTDFRSGTCARTSRETSSASSTPVAC